MMYWGESSYFTSSNEGVAIKKRIKSARVRMKDEIFLVKANAASISAQGIREINQDNS